MRWHVQQCAQARGALELAGMGPRRVDPAVECLERPHEDFEGERGNDVGLLHGHRRTHERLGAKRSHELSAVDHRQAFFGAQHYRLKTVLGEHLGRLPIRLLRRVPHLANANKPQREMGEGSKVSRSADGALGGHKGETRLVESANHATHIHGRNAAKALRKHVDAKREEHARARHREGLADASSVRLDQIDLQFAQLVARDARRGKVAKAGVDAIDGVSLLHNIVNNFAAGANSLRSGYKQPCTRTHTPRTTQVLQTNLPRFLRQVNVCLPVTQHHEVFGRERSAVQAIHFARHLVFPAAKQRTTESREKLHGHSNLLSPPLLSSCSR
eukprot:Opistho-1_new@79605